MRISEKTVELNFCSQFSRNFPGRVIWFGLTQRQEARAGFDACTKLGGLLLLIQFKASSHDVRWPAPPPHAFSRRFHAPHHQFLSLKARVRRDRRIFYAFPLIGTDLELAKQQDLMATTWLLDVATAPMLAAPTTRAGVARKSEVHYVDVIPGHAVIHSEPVAVTLTTPSALAETLLIQMRQTRPVADAIGFNQFWPRGRRLFPKHAVGGIVLLS